MLSTKSRQNSKVVNLRHQQYCIHELLLSQHVCEACGQVLPKEKNTSGSSRDLMEPHKTIDYFIFHSYTNGAFLLITLSHAVDTYHIRITIQ